MTGFDYTCLSPASQNGSAKGCESESEKEISHLSNYRFVMMAAQFLHGCGASPLYTLGITYIDDNTPTKMTSVYIGRLPVVAY